MRPLHAVLALAGVACIVLVQINLAPACPACPVVRCWRPRKLAPGHAPSPPLTPPSSPPPPPSPPPSPPPPPPPPPCSPPPSRLPSASDDCHTFEHTEMGGGSVVGGGARLRLASARECCEACRAHNPAQPRPRGRLNCTTWVYNHDPTHPQARECWFKRHDAPWADIELLANGSSAWTTGLTLAPPPRAAGVAPTARSCGDGRWRRAAEHIGGPLYVHPRTEGVHSEELSLCPPVRAEEAHLALIIGSGGADDADRTGGHGNRSGAGRANESASVVRIRLNGAMCPLASAWIDGLLREGTCAELSRARCAPHCCHFYRGEAAMGVQALPDALYRAHGYDAARPPRWGRGYWWGPPYAFLQGRLWHAGPGPWRSNATALPTEGTLPTLHRGTVELVGGGPDLLIALADHPMMPPHNAFGHVVLEDMPRLDALLETRALVVQNWGAINATVFKSAVPFALRRL